jgi:tetratricopeptide (TPR) repeat protein
MATILPRCLWLALCPLDLSIDPEVTLRAGFSDPRSACGALGIVGLVGWALWRGTPAVRTGTCLAAACCVPWVVVPLNAMLCEHRLYGLLAGCVLAASSLAPRWPRPLALRVAAAAACAVLALRSSWRSLDYRDEVRLWQQVHAQQPYSPRALFALGVARLVAGEPLAARPLFERAIAVYPRHWRARRYLAMAELQIPREASHPFAALYHVRLVREQSPHDPFVRLLTANCLVAAGEWSGDAGWFAEAEREALSCLDIAEPKGLVYINAARARELAGDADGALGLLDTSIARGLDHATVLLAKAEILRRAGRTAEARAVLRTLLARDPFDQSVHEALARVEASGPR